MEKSSQAISFYSQINFEVDFALEMMFHHLIFGSGLFSQSREVLKVDQAKQLSIENNLNDKWVES